MTRQTVYAPIAAPSVEAELLLSSAICVSWFSQPNLLVGDAIISRGRGSVRITTLNAPKTLTSTPTILDPVIDGQYIRICNVGAFAITLQDEVNLAGSKIRAGGANIALAQWESVLLQWSAVDGYWFL